MEGTGGTVENVSWNYTISDAIFILESLNCFDAAVVNILNYFKIDPEITLTNFMDEINLNIVKQNLDGLNIGVVKLYLRLCGIGMVKVGKEKFCEFEKLWLCKDVHYSVATRIPQTNLWIVDDNLTEVRKFNRIQITLIELIFTFLLSVSSFIYPWKKLFVGSPQIRGVEVPPPLHPKGVPLFSNKK
jgi:hypothetical protein